MEARGERDKQFFASALILSRETFFSLSEMAATG
jgi:hypothetical protein